MSTPFFSVIVLNWNGRDLIAECLSSLRGQAFRDFEVVLVDNGSTDGSAEWISGQADAFVRVVLLPANRGYAEGNNAGIRQAKGRWIVLLNNDTAVDPDWLAQVAAAIERHPEAGMFTPKILNYYRRDEIDNTGHLIYPDGLARGQNRLEKDDGRFDVECEAAWPSGCAGFYKRDLLDEVGLLDERFFAYAEDVDLGLRGRRAGWGCWYVPAARVYHKYSVTSGSFSPRKAFLVERNRFWVLLKNFPLREIALSPAATGWRYLMHLRSALSGRGSAGRLAGETSVFTLFATTLRAEFAALAGAPGILRERRRLAPTRKLSDDDFRALIRRFRLTAAEAAMKE
ncbi:MAG TPA: glycosyltransferase family 2 protein [Candidatus Deferrimicrobiaceae bacterium]